jgi:hypothetical protein
LITLFITIDQLAVRLDNRENNDLPFFVLLHDAMGMIVAQSDYADFQRLTVRSNYTRHKYRNDKNTGSFKTGSFLT